MWTLWVKPTFKYHIFVRCFPFFHTCFYFFSALFRRTLVSSLHYFRISVLNLFSPSSDPWILSISPSCHLDFPTFLIPPHLSVTQHPSSFFLSKSLMVQALTLSYFYLMSVTDHTPHLPLFHFGIISMCPWAGFPLVWRILCLVLELEKIFSRSTLQGHLWFSLCVLSTYKGGATCSFLPVIALDIITRG